eukprot:SAG31_NODE_761_length_12276_cov_4.530673_17_plen_412_part_00
MALKALQRKTSMYWAMCLLQQDIDSLESCNDTLESLNDWLLTTSIRWRYHFQQDVSVGQHFYDAYGPHPNTKPEEDRFVQWQIGVKYGVNFRRIFRIPTGEDECKVPPDTIKKKMKQFLETHRAKAEANWKADVLHEELLSGDAQCYKRAFKSPRLYSGNLNNLKQLSRDLNKVARIDRLPESNSEQAMIIIRHAWDLVDIYTFNSGRMKIVAKSSYYIMLLLSFCSSAIVLMALNSPDFNSQLHRNTWNTEHGVCLSDDALQLSCCVPNVTIAAPVSVLAGEEWWHIDNDLLSKWVIGLSLTASFMAAVTTYIDPGQRWMQLRGAALNLEAEIWKFRTRTGAYALTSRKELQSKLGEEHLRQYSEQLKQHVGKAASVRYERLRSFDIRNFSATNFDFLAHFQQYIILFKV